MEKPGIKLVTLQDFKTLSGELAKSGCHRDTAAAFGDAMEPAVSAVVAGYSAIMLTKDHLNNPMWWPERPLELLHLQDFQPAWLG